METSYERWRQIALTYFDYYVLEYLANQAYVISDISGELNERELENFSSRIKQNSDRVHSAIILSCGRISQEEVHPILFKEEEDTIVKSVIKLLLKENDCSLFIQRRKIGTIRSRMNHINPSLKVSLSEFIEFLKPLYIEAVEEVFYV